MNIVYCVLHFNKAVKNCHDMETPANKTHLSEKNEYIENPFPALH